MKWARRVGGVALVVLVGCGPSSGKGLGPSDGSAPDGDGAVAPPDGGGAGAACGTPAECGRLWEQNASDLLDQVAGDPDGLIAFLTAMPKGGDLHNHLTGAVYAETYLDWAKADGDCINSSTFSVVYGNQCSTSTQPVPSPGSFYDQIVRAWSMQGFVAGAESGHDHFFATFSKYGAVAGAHRDDSLADLATRAASENQLYLETMFNLGKNLGDLAASAWSGTVTADTLPAFYDQLVADAGFATQLANDVAVVTEAATRYRATLGCDGPSPPPACDVQVRFVAQVSRTGALDQVFGQLVAAYEIAAKTPQLVALNLSSPEDDTTSLKNYDLHMAMLDFLYGKYTATQKSPLHVTLHAGELVPAYLPSGYPTANTFHVRAAVEKGHAERIGHGVDVLSESDPEALLAELHDRDVLVEVCLSSNAQILDVSGAAHPLAQYLAHGVPVALATDDQGVSRSSLAGEYARAVLDQHLDYRQLKALGRNSLEHAFVPGASLWASIAEAQPAGDCAPDAASAAFEQPGAACAAFLAASERARLEWELERRFREFERQF